MPQLPKTVVQASDQSPYGTTVSKVERLTMSK